MLVADSIGKRYGFRPVLTAVSLWARSGSVTALLGSNGTGKSTLLRITADVLNADYGHVVFKDRHFSTPRLATLARLGLLYLPDRSFLCAWRTVRQHFDALSRAFRLVRAAEAIGRFRLEPVLDKTPTTLSAGERRRAEAALAFARRPDCLLADEPFRGIDPADQELLAAGFRHMATEGVAILVTGHEVAILLDTADDVIWATAGTTHGLGSVPAARSNHQFMREYLGGRLL